MLAHVRDQLADGAVGEDLDLGRVAAQRDIDAALERALGGDLVHQVGDGGAEALGVQQRRPQLEAHPAHPVDRLRERGPRPGHALERAAGVVAVDRRLAGVHADERRHHHLHRVVVQLDRDPLTLGLLGPQHRAEQRPAPLLARLERPLAAQRARAGRLGVAAALALGDEQPLALDRVLHRPGDQIAGGPSLQEVVARPGAERLERQLLLVAAGQHEDRQVGRARAEPAERLEPAGIGQREVGHDGVGRRGREVGERRAQPARDGDLEPGAELMQLPLQQVGGDLVGVDQQQPHTAPGGVTSPLADPARGDDRIPRRQRRPGVFGRGPAHSLRC